MNSPTTIQLPKKIETSRLTLRPWQKNDLEHLHLLHQENKDELNKWYGGILSQKTSTKQDIQTYLDNVISGWHDKSWIEYPVFDKETGALIGMVSIHHLDWSVPKGRVGYIVHKNKTGKGLATEMANIITRYAFDILKLKRLEIRAATTNPASHIIPRKLNYQFLTIFEKNKVATNGDLWDLEIHARLDCDSLPNIDISWSYI